MSDFGGGGFSADYGLSPYGSNYNNTGFQGGSYNPSTPIYDSNGAVNYGLSNQNYGSSGGISGGGGGGFNLPGYNGTSSVGNNFTPYTDAYNNQGFGNGSYQNIVNPYIQGQGNYKDLLTEMMQNNYGGTDSGGNYKPFPRNFFPNDPAAQAPQFDSGGYSLSSGFNQQGFNRGGINSEGLNNLGLRYNATGRNYTDGGFNYDSGKGTSVFSGSTAAKAGDSSGAGAAMGSGSLLDATRKDLSNRQTNGNGQERPQWDLKGLSSLLGAIQNARSGGQQQQARGTAQQATNNSQQQIATNNAVQQQQIKTLSEMYGQDSPYAQVMRQQLERQDAAAGRRSQYGQREVELQAKLASLNAGNANNILNSIGNVSSANSNANKSILEGTQAGLGYGTSAMGSDGRLISSIGDFLNESGLSKKIGGGLQTMWNGMNTPSGTSSYWR